MKAILKKPGEAPEIVEVDNDRKALSEIIGGQLKSFALATDACILYAEEGGAKGLPINMELMGLRFSGPILFAGTNGNKLCDFPILEPWVERMTL